MTDDSDRRTRGGRAEDLTQPPTLVEEILEPHASLRYVARLFKVLAVLLLLLLVAEAVIGLSQQGQEAIPTLLVEATRLIVFAGFLWGAGDMALMFIESNHDIRATRVLVWQLTGLMRTWMAREGIETDPVPLPMNPGDVWSLSRESDDE